MSRNTKKIKATSLLPMCVIVGFFIGVGLGALMQAFLMVMIIGVVAGAGLGYYLDKKNGITYGRRH